LTVLAPTLARAVYDRVPRRVVCALDTLLPRAGRRAGEPAAYLGHAGWSRTTGLCHEAPRASTHAHEHRGPWPGPCACAGTPARAPGSRANVLDGDRGLPLPRTCASRAHTEVPPRVGVGRSEGTDELLGHREPEQCSLSPPSRWRSTRKKCVVPSRWCTSRRKRRRHTLPKTDDAQPEPRRKKWAQSALREGLSLDNGGPHKGWAGIVGEVRALSLLPPRLFPLMPNDEGSRM